MKEGEKTQRPPQQRLDVVGHKGGEDKEPPHAVNDAGHRGQQLNERAHGAADPGRGQLHQEKGDGQAQGNRNDHGDEGGDQGADDAAARPEFLEHRVPFLGKEKAPAELLDRRPGRAEQLQPDGQHHQRHQQRAEEGQPAEGPVASRGRLDPVALNGGERGRRHVLLALGLGRLKHHGISVLPMSNQKTILVILKRSEESLFKRRRDS